MKVLIVTPSYFPIVGGSEILTRALSTELNEAGIHTDIMAFNMEKKWKPIYSEKVETGINHQVFKMPALNPFPFLQVSPLHPPLRINVLPKPGFKKKFHDYDIIHFLGEADLSMPILSRSIQKPKIMHCVAIPGLGNRHAMMGKILARIFRTLANLYIVFSPEEKAVLEEMGIPKNKIAILPEGVDTEIFHPDREQKLNDLILFVGRIYPLKGLHILLESLQYLNSKAQVVLIGPVNDPVYFKQIDRMRLKINANGFHNVKYLGSINHSELVNWYQKATVLVRPDLIGVSGQGLSALEALACGTPVIGTQNHVIIHNENGLIVPPNNPAKLAEALELILTSKETREKYGRSAARRIEEGYSLKSVAARLIEMYKKMLDTSKNPCT
ncbi:MAG: glycosyltransferase family 4 protein [Candidatus Bathyarchaeia archaeon]|jgi:glycosyltransferase involved in cell wall biosynthesis